MIQMMKIFHYPIFAEFSHFISIFPDLFSHFFPTVEIIRKIRMKLQ